MKVISKKRHLYIAADSKIQGGEPIIRGTRISVRSVVLYILRQGMPPETMAKEFRISLAALYDALSFYYDHRSYMDRLIERQSEKAA